GGLWIGKGSTRNVVVCPVADNQASGGAGAAGGNGLGGGIYTELPNPVFGSPRLTILDSLITDNQANGGAASTAGSSAGLGAGGGIWSGGLLAVLGTQLVHNQAQGGDGTSGANAGNGFGGGLYIASGTAAITNTL